MGRLVRVPARRRRHLDRRLALAVDLVVPAGSRARFVLPPGDWWVEHDGRPVPDGTRPRAHPDDRPEVTLPSGRHRLVLTPA